MGNHEKAKLLRTYVSPNSVPFLGMKRTNFDKGGDQNVSEAHLWSCRVLVRLVLSNVESSADIPSPMIFAKHDITSRITITSLWIPDGIINTFATRLPTNIVERLIQHIALQLRRQRSHHGPLSRPLAPYTHKMVQGLYLEQRCHSVPHCRIML